MLTIKNVSASIDKDTPLIKDINLQVNEGEIHAIMGPVGCGKTALANIIQGTPFLTHTNGDIIFKRKNINKLAPHKRSQLGILATFQYPPEVEGFTNRDLIKSALETRPCATFSNDIEQSFKNLVKALGLDSKFTDDMVNNYSRSFVDHKKSEVIQAVMLQPDLLILDEIDVDLDEESLTDIAETLKAFVSSGTKSLIVITHSQKLLDLLQPTHVHIMVAGEIKEQGTTELYKRIVEDGYSQFS